MKITTESYLKSLETALIALNHVIAMLPDKGEIEGLNGDLGENFIQLSDSMTIIEDKIEKIKTILELQKKFKEQQF